MRVGMVITSWDRPCGVGEYGRTLVETLRRLERPVEVLTVLPGQAAAQARGHALDLVHFQYEYNLYDAAELSHAVNELERSGTRCVVTVHSWVPGADYANRLLREGVPRLIVTLPALRLAMQRSGIDGSRVAVFPIGIPTYAMPPQPVLRNSLGLAGEPSLGFFGFIHHHKGLENLGLAVRELRRRYPNLCCFLFASVAPNEGSRRAGESLRSFYDARGLWEGMHLQEGYLPEEEVVRRLHAMDVNILPYAELQGVQASAAARTVLAAQRPTIVTDTTHFSDLRDEVYRIPDNAPEQIVAAVTDLLDHPEKARPLIQKTGLLARRCGWEQVANAHWRYYTQVVTGSGVHQGRQAVRVR